MFGNLFNGGFSGGVTTKSKIGMFFAVFIVIILLFIALVYLLPSNSVTDKIKSTFNKVLPSSD
jgi:hypothetical protein